VCHVGFVGESRQQTGGDVETLEAFRDALVDSAEFGEQLLSFGWLGRGGCGEAAREDESGEDGEAYDEWVVG